MMTAAKGLSHNIPQHVLRVGQTICLDSEPHAFNQHLSFTEPGCNHGNPDLNISLDHLNQLILDLDPTFEPIEVTKDSTYIHPLAGDCAASFSRTSLISKHTTMLAIRKQGQQW